MSSDYRPRGGSSSGGPGGPGGSSGGRRRRGGRNRGGRGRSGEHRPHSSHTNGTSSAPAKKEHPIAKLFGWLTGKNKKKTTEHKSHTQHESPRHESRPPRADRADRPPRAERPPREDRPQQEDPTPQEIATPKLYVGNLSYDAAESDLFDLFSKIGLVKNVEIALDRRSNRSKGFGFVEMDSLDVAKEASAKLNRTDFMGRQIVVSGAKMERRSVNNRDDETETGGRSEEESAI